MAKPFTGVHMAAILVGGFAIVVGVNLVMARAAISTFGGVVVENSYVASQKFNGWLDQAEKAKALGWNVNIRRSDDDRMLVTTENLPRGAVVRAVARHPLGHLPDSELQFAPVGEGRYLSTSVLPAGRWIVRLEVASGDDVWRGERDLR